MGSCLLVWILLVCILNPCCIKSWKLSKEENLKLDKQLKLLNKPAIQSIKSYYGNIYDCVDFYKQPAFDHPLLKNFTFEKSKLLQLQRRANYSSESTKGISLPRGGCPVGTVPIRRITKNDLLRERLASNVRSMTAENLSGTHFAIDKTQASLKRYGGISAGFSIWNPPCAGHQYSAARVKIMNVPDTIEAGWRVDPTLYGDSKTHLYIRTDAGQTRCFDTRCPGFVVTDRKVPLGYVFTDISKIGKPIFQTNVNILRDNGSGDWSLQVGPDNIHIGFWPGKIFKSGVGLGQLASSLEWGGEVFSPLGTPKPPMGAGDFPPDDSDTNYCAYFGLMQEVNESGQIVDANDVDPYADSEHYKISDEGFHGGKVGHILVYGGPGGSTD